MVTLLYFRGIRLVVFNLELYLDANDARKAISRRYIPLVEL